MDLTIFRYNERQIKTNSAKKNNLVLVGMPASGKSTLGKILAKLIKKDFIDTDDCMKRTLGIGPSELLNTTSFDEFIEQEAEIVKQLNCSDSVIATGGSVVYSSEAMYHLKESSIVIYLEVSSSASFERVGDVNGRGVILRPGQNFISMYEERCRLYEKYADIYVNTEQQELDTLCSNLVSYLKELALV